VKQSVKPHLFSLWGILLSLTIPCHGEIFAIDFETAGGCNPAIIDHGIMLTNQRGTICTTTSGGNRVSNDTTYINDSSGLQIVQTEGQTFTLVAVDLAEYSISVGAPKPVVFIGTKPSGATVSFSYTLDQIRDGVGGAKDFETVILPSDFEDVISVASSAVLYSIDNLVISAIVPPPLPANQASVAPGFHAPTVLRTQALLDDYFVVGSDFEYKAGFYPPTWTEIITEANSTKLLATAFPSYDRASSTLVYKNGTSIQKFRNGTVTTLVTLQELVNAGFPFLGLSKSVWSNDRLVFMATNSSGGDSYGIFQLNNGVITSLVTPGSVLPGNPSSGTPHHYPDFLAVQGASFAFDTSITGSTSIQRVFVSFGGESFQLTASEGDSTPFGTVTGFDGLGFNATGNLEIAASIGSSKCRLEYNATGLASSKLLTLTIAPVNVGELVTGTIKTESGSAEFLDTNSAIFRKSGDHWFRVIGIGDLIDGQPVSVLNFLATRRGHPDRIIVEARYQDIGTARYHFEIQLNSAAELPPRFGATLIHPESGDLYIPLSHLTYGRNYKVTWSPDLIHWQDFQAIQKILPIQYVVIPADRLVSPVFFRVEEY
jgi:hypothetical protein